MINYDGTTSLAKAIADDLQLCSLNNTNRIAKLTQKAAAALGLPIDTTGGKKSTADCLAIYEWLKTNYVAPTLAIESAEPATVSLFDNDETFAIGNVTAPHSNEIATIIKYDTVSHLNELNQVVINADVIADIKNTLALELQFKKVANMHASRVGGLLLQVKAELNHGEFLPWLAENFNLSDRQARRYIQVAKGVPPRLRTIGKTDTVSVLNPPTDLVAKLESHETETLRLENEKLQRDLLAAKQAADDLRNNQTQIIDAKVSAVIAIERADLVVENSAAMQALEKQLSDAKDKIAQQKKDFEKEVKDGVRREMSAKEWDVERLEYKKERVAKDIAELQKTEKRLLDKQIGTVQRHQEFIKKIKDDLASVGINLWDLLEDSGSTPVEVLHDWHLIDDAVDKIKQDVLQIIDNGKTLHEVIKSQPIDGELVDI